MTSFCKRVFSYMFFVTLIFQYFGLGWAYRLVGSQSGLDLYVYMGGSVLNGFYRDFRP